LDRLLELLFGSMLPMFLYNIRRKAMGMVVNWKKEEVAISSVWAAENEMKNAKVWNHFLSTVIPKRACIYVTFIVFNSIRLYLGYVYLL
jgi:hypothetical protein